MHMRTATSLMSVDDVAEVVREQTRFDNINGSQLLKDLKRKRLYGSFETEGLNIGERLESKGKAHENTKRSRSGGVGCYGRARTAAQDW